jgi:hypothetical protein
MQATIQATAPTAPSTSLQTWSGRVASAFAILFLLMDGGVKVFQLAAATDSSVALGLRADLTLAIGLLELACLAIYAFPHTATPGAVLLTGYLGGAIAIQLRADAPAFNIIFPLIIGAFVWGGLVLRDARLRACILNR